MNLTLSAYLLGLVDEVNLDPTLLLLLLELRDALGECGLYNEIHKFTLISTLDQTLIYLEKSYHILL